jgi:alpha-mannosidase
MRVRGAFLLALAALLASTFGFFWRVRWKTTTTATASPVLRKFAATSAPRVLNVHVMPHTHDDVGWRKTVEQYYDGTNETIDNRGRVGDILTTTIAALLANPARTFTWTESKFLHMWWTAQIAANRTAKHDSLRFLIANEQWSFVNGGWCMHDEACTHYIGMMDQTTLGHAFLQEILGVVPTVGWQLDPFGHAATQASLLTAAVGFDALYFGRIDYQDLELRRQQSECEGLWQAGPSSSPDDNNDNDRPPVFWGLTGEYGGNYGPPAGYCFDVLCDDESLLSANQTRLRGRTLTFLHDLARQANQTKGAHLMVTMGSDFHFQNAAVNFANIDLLMTTITEYQEWGMLDAADIFGPRFDRVNIFYSTPNYYTAQKNEETRRYYAAPNHTKSDSLPLWSIKKDDFFPYADCPHCYWTGYFTSRTAFKRLERVASAFLQGARQLDSLPQGNGTSAQMGEHAPCDCRGFVPCGCTPPLFELEDALGVAQHHDAVSGTAKQHVADDYSRRVQAGLNRASRYTAHLLKHRMLNDTASLPNLAFCQLLNETKCHVSQEATQKDAEDVYVIVYNPLASERSAIVRLPVAADKTYTITSLSTNSQQAHVGKAVLAFPLPGAASTEEQSYVLNLNTGKLPPVGAAAFRISTTNTTEATATKVSPHPFSFQEEAGSIMSAIAGSLKVFFDLRTGAIKKIATADMELPVEQQWGYYEPFDSSFDTEADPRENSGAYLFRPSTPDQELRIIRPKPGGATFVETSVGMEVHVTYEQPWIRQVTRVTTNQPWVEIEYTVGPLPIEEGRGKEVVSRFLTSIQNNGTFYTDSNGREFLRRQRDYRPTWPLEVNEPIAGNYYPVNAAIYLEDQDASFSILTDRTRGGASIFDGSLEVMVQRRTVADDHRGVDEALNETVGGMTPYPPYGRAERIGPGVIVKGIHRLLVGVGSSGAAIARSSMDGVFAEPLVFVGSAPASEPVPFRQPSFSVLGRALPLPPNVMLTTLTRVRGKDKRTLLLRLGHQYAVGESVVLSRPVKVNLSLLLAGHYNVLNVTEMTLSGNQDKSSYLSRRFNWTRSGSHMNERAHGPVTTITLKPMEIRTFEVLVEERHSGSKLPVAYS